MFPFPRGTGTDFRFFCLFLSRGTQDYPKEGIAKERIKISAKIKSKQRSSIGKSLLSPMLVADG